MKLIQPTPPSHRKLERVISWTILVLGCLAVPYTHGTLQYFGLLLVGILLVVLNHVIIAATARVRGPETHPGEGRP